MVNDGSPDASLDAALSLTHVDPRVRVVVEHVPLADLARARHGEGAPAAADVTPEVAGLRATAGQLDL